MPELYGKPFKSKLYRQVRELQSVNAEASKEVRQLRTALRYAKIRNDELEAKIKRMQEKSQAVIDEGNQDIEAAVSEKFGKSLFPKRTIQ